MNLQTTYIRVLSYPFRLLSKILTLSHHLRKYLQRFNCKMPNHAYQSNSKIINKYIFNGF